MKIDELLINNRVCPQPMIWNNIWELIQKESKEKIATPLILGSWHYTSDEEKKERFIYHFEKAEELGIIEKVKNLLNIQENEWHHK